MVVLDLLGRRSALRILWELRDGQPRTFRVLQAAAQTNPSLLNTRLGELREVQLVKHEGDGYMLTPSGQALLTSLRPLADWASEWGEKQAAPRALMPKAKPRPNERHRQNLVFPTHHCKP